MLSPLIPAKTTVKPITHSSLVLGAAWVTFALLAKKREQIATVTDKGFDIDLNNMVVGKKYLVRYEDSTYRIMRTSNDELELFEVA